MTVILKGTSPYLAKDQLKANQANKFIGQGSINSSTNSYRQCFGNKANCGEYIKEDIVFVSSEGNRKNRLAPNYFELALAIEAEVTFITDKPYDRNRSYNIGEREVASFLIENGYKEQNDSGIWKKE